MFLKLFFGGFFSLVFSGALEFTRQDLPHVNVRTAITNVYGDLFARVCSSFPWFQNPVFLSIAQKVGIFWQTWEDSISDLISSSAGRPVSLKLQDGNKFSPDQILFLDQLISRSADVNPGVILTRLLSSSKPDFPEYVQVSACTSFASEVFVSMVWYELLHLWYMAFCNVLCEKIKDAFARKLSIPRNSVYNFTDVEIDARTLDILSHGPHYIPTFGEPNSLIIGRIHEFCKNLALEVARLTSTRIPIDYDGTFQLLDGLHRNSHPMFKEFFEILSLSLSRECECVGLHAPIVPEQGKFSSYSDISAHSSPPGTIFILADKGRGVALLPIAALLEAEEKVLLKLGALLCPEETADSILRKVRQKNVDLKSSLCPKQSSFMASFPSMPLQGQDVTFLKLSVKIHKLSDEEIADKRLDLLRFRPICDSVHFPIRPASSALFSLLLALKNKVFACFPSLVNFFPLSGQHYVKNLKTIPQFPPKSDPYYVFLSADLADAYTNCNLQQLKSSYLFLASLVGVEIWEQDLVVKLADLVLTNTYVQSGGKFYLLGSMLPIGASCSGEALDIIALSGEVMAFSSPPLDETSLSLVPAYIDPNAPVIFCGSYSRYRDDTMVPCSGKDVGAIISSIRDISTRIFPPSIPISLEVSIFFTSFLDVCFFPNFADRSFTTFLRMNFDAPGKVPHFSSNSPYKYLLAPCLSNTVRALRICSNEVLFKVTKELFISEYMYIGYPPRTVHNLRTRVGLLVRKHLHVKEFVFDPDKSEFVVQDLVKIVSPWSFTPPSALFCNMTGVHRRMSAIWSSCRDLLPFDTRSVTHQLRRDVQSAISCKSLYFKKIREFYAQ